MQYSIESASLSPMNAAMRRLKVALECTGPPAFQCTVSVKIGTNEPKTIKLKGEKVPTVDDLISRLVEDEGILGGKSFFIKKDKDILMPHIEFHKDKEEGLTAVEMKCEPIPDLTKGKHEDFKDITTFQGLVEKYFKDQWHKNRSNNGDLSMPYIFGLKWCYEKSPDDQQQLEDAKEEAVALQAQLDELQERLVGSLADKQELQAQIAKVEGNLNTSNAKRENLQVRTYYEKYGRINDWDVQYVTEMKKAFYGLVRTKYNEGFNRNISRWNVGNVTTMEGMFHNANDFNQPIGNWNVGNVTNMREMFCRAICFNQYLGEWASKVTKVKDMYRMFYRAYDFEASGLEEWKVDEYCDKTEMFKGSEAYRKAERGKLAEEDSLPKWAITK